MKIINKKIEELTPYENNPRNNQEAIEYVANSIQNFGFKVPLVIDKNNVIVCGHTRYESAKKLGMEEVPCIVADDLTDEQIKAYRLADNKVGEIASWDFNALDIELDDIDMDMEQFGFLKEIEEELGKIIEKPEVEFTEVLGEEHNYIVLYFDNEVDWIQAESLFDIKEKKNLSTRKDGTISKNMERKSIGRVLNGAKAIERILRNENKC